MHVKRHVVPINLVREDPLTRSRLLFRGAPTHLPRGFPDSGLDFCPDRSIALVYCPALIGAAPEPLSVPKTSSS
jgi:hypothetical protein